MAVANLPHPDDKPKDEVGVPIELWGLKFRIPLPKPALAVLTGIVLVAALGLFYKKALQPITDGYVIVQKAAWLETKKNAAERDQLLPTVQGDQWRYQFNRSPKTAHRAPQAVELGYYDDGAILFTRTFPNFPPVQYWFLDLSR